MGIDGRLWWTTQSSFSSGDILMHVSSFPWKLNSHFAKMEMNSRSGVSGTLHMVPILDPEPRPQGQCFWLWPNSRASQLPPPWGLTEKCWLPDRLHQMLVLWCKRRNRWPSHWVWKKWVAKKHTHFGVTHQIIMGNSCEIQQQPLLCILGVGEVFTSSPSHSLTGATLTCQAKLSSQGSHEWVLSTKISHSSSSSQQTKAIHLNPASAFQHKHTQGPKRHSTPGYCILGPTEKDPSCLVISPRHPRELSCSYLKF